METSTFTIDGAEITVATEVGPRILGIKRPGGANLFAELPGIVIETDDGPFSFYGGHRLWRAPEVAATTYLPDDDPVTVSSEERLGHRRRPRGPRWRSEVDQSSTPLPTRWSSITGSRTSGGPRCAAARGRSPSSLRVGWRCCPSPRGSPTRPVPSPTVGSCCGPTRIPVVRRSAGAPSTSRLPAARAKPARNSARRTAAAGWPTCAAVRCS